MDSKEYVAPKMVELGNLSSFTRNGTMGENFDGNYTEEDFLSGENGGEIFGS